MSLFGLCYFSTMTFLQNKNTCYLTLYYKRLNALTQVFIWKHNVYKQTRCSILCERKCLNKSLIYLREKDALRARYRKSTKSLIEFVSWYITFDLIKSDFIFSYILLEIFIVKLKWIAFCNFIVNVWNNGTWSNCSKPCGFSNKFRWNQCIIGCAKFGSMSYKTKEYSVCNVNECDNNLYGT